MMNKECPDRQMLSVYFDRELPSPWKDKMEAHIAGCPQCAQYLQAYRNSSLAADGEDTAICEARERVWQKLEQGIGITRPDSRIVIASRPAIWRRRVSIPLPVAAAAVIFLVLALLLGLKITENTRLPETILASETDVDIPGIIPASADMENVLQYLGNRDNGEIIIIRLPESRNFVNYSEPAIIKAADYSRNTPGWSKR
jgi:hypothetical protein